LRKKSEPGQKTKKSGGSIINKERGVVGAKEKSHKKGREGGFILGGKGGSTSEIEGGRVGVKSYRPKTAFSMKGVLRGGGIRACRSGRKRREISGRIVCSFFLGERRSPGRAFNREISQGGRRFSVKTRKHQQGQIGDARTVDIVFIFQSRPEQVGRRDLRVCGQT